MTEQYTRKISNRKTGLDDTNKEEKYRWNDPGGTQGLGEYF